MTSKIKEFKSELKNIIKTTVGEATVVMTKLFPGSAESLDDLKKNAQLDGSSVAFITYAGRKYGEKKGGIYHPYESFHIYIFSKIYDDESEHSEDVEILVEKITDGIFYGQKNYEFIGHVINPVYTENKDFFMAVIEVGKWLPVYPIKANLTGE